MQSSDGSRMLSNVRHSLAFSGENLKKTESFINRFFTEKRQTAASLQQIVARQLPLHDGCTFSRKMLIHSVSSHQTGFHQHSARSNFVEVSVGQLSGTATESSADT